MGKGAGRRKEGGSRQGRRSGDITTPDVADSLLLLLLLLLVPPAPLACCFPTGPATVCHRSCCPYQRLGVQSTISVLPSSSCTAQPLLRSLSRHFSPPNLTRSINALVQGVLVRSVVIRLALARPLAQMLGDTGKHSAVTCALRRPEVGEGLNNWVPDGGPHSTRSPGGLQEARVPSIARRA